MIKLKILFNGLRRYRKLFSSLFVIGFVSLVICYVFKNIREFSTLEITNWWLLGVVFIAVLVRNFSTGLVMDTALRPLNVHLRIIESFGLANLTRLVNQIMPGNVGIVMRSMYLKRRYKLSYASFASSFAASQIVLYLISTILGILSFYGSKDTNTHISLLLHYFLFALLVGLLCLIVFPKKMTNNISHNRLRKGIEGWYVIRGNKRVLLRLSVSSLLFILASTIIMYANFTALGHPISLYTALFFSSVNMVNTFIAFTPAGFGVSEGIIVLLAKSASIPVSVGLAVALLQRVITFFAVIIVAPYFSKKLFNIGPAQLLKNLKLKQH